MSRLTRFVIDEYFAKNFDYESLIKVPDEDFKAFNEIVDKLGHYETLEEKGMLIEPKQGKWVNERITKGGFHEEWGYDCSECGATYHDKTNYCANCGAKMVKGTEE